jgi:hypothetical protein
VYDQNAAAVRQFLVYDSTNTLANATQVTVTVTKPDATIVGPTTITPSPTGTYTYTAPTDLAGRYLVYWQATGTNFTAKSDQYDVRSSVSVALLSLSDAKAVLNIPATDYSQDEKIRDKLDAVTDEVEAIIGYVVPRSITTTVTATGSAFFLPGPVISLTSMTPVLTNGWAYTAGDFAVTTSGLVTRLDGSRLSGQAYTVVYQAGRSGPVHARILEAARLLLQHFWDTQRAPDLRPGQGGDSDAIDMATGIPPRVYEILQRDRIVSCA